MSQNITLMGNTYSNVPSVTLPTSSGGTASFVDTSDATASASDIASGMTAYVNGSLITGTASGGSSWTLLGSSSFTVSTTSTSASSVGTISCGSGAFDKSVVIYVRVRGQSGKRTGYFLGSDAFFINYQNANSSTSTLTYAGRIIHYVNSSGNYAEYVAATTGGYGVYAYSISSSGVVTIRRRYNSSYSLTIDDTFDVEVYALSYPDGESVFDI